MKDTAHSNRYRFSIRTQFSVIFIGLMTAVVTVCILLSVCFLSDYYIGGRTKVLIKAYEQLLSTATADTLGSEETAAQLDELARRYNLSIIIVGADSEELYASDTMYVHNLKDRIFFYIFDQPEEHRNEHIIRKNSDYLIRQITVGKSEELLEMIGRLDSGATFMISMPVESIRESATYANRFFIMVGLLGALAGGIIIYLATRSITRPILELSRISEQMVHLDFDAKYTGNETNEIGMLGGNINMLSDSLERSISELKTANNELRRDIEQKEKLDALRQDFIANVSHELKTPIALIQGYAEGLKEGITEDAESREYYCDVIMDEASKMNEMVRKLLNLNQLEFGGKDVSLGRFELTQLISEYLQSARLLAQQDGIEVILDAPEKTYVWGDEDLAEEVFTNYYSNAVHYCSENAAGVKQIRVRVQPGEETVRVWVENTGQQIPEESIPRLWEKFYKVDKARTREYGGSGIGLSIVKAVQDALGQAYGVENTADGVAFWFELAAK